jgi:hypothetical protein
LSDEALGRAFEDITFRTQGQLRKNRNGPNGRLLAQVLEEHSIMKLAIRLSLGDRVFTCDICMAYPRYVHGDANHKLWGLASESEAGPPKVATASGVTKLCRNVFPA